MSLFESAIGWLAPPQCLGCGIEGSTLCEMCIISEISPHGERCGFCGRLSSTTCPRCRRAGAPKHVWIVTDYEGIAQKLLQVYKFNHLRTASKEITAMLAETLLYYNDRSELDRINYLVVPVPTATTRRRKRGFGHAELLAAGTARSLKLDSHNALARLGQTRQVGAKRAVRIAQQADNYLVRHPDKIKGRNILLIDDVVTTGATLRAVTKVLRQVGAKRVDALVFAKRL